MPKDDPLGLPDDFKPTCPCPKCQSKADQMYPGEETLAYCEFSTMPAPVEHAAISWTNNGVLLHALVVARRKDGAPAFPAMVNGRPFDMREFDMFAWSWAHVVLEPRGVRAGVPPGGAHLPTYPARLIARTRRYAVSRDL